MLNKGNPQTFVHAIISNTVIASPGMCFIITVFLILLESSKVVVLNILDVLDTLKYFL